MLRTLLDIAMNWTARRLPPVGEIHNEGAGGHFLTTASFTAQQTAEGQAISDFLATPDEWVCACGRRSPLATDQRHAGELPPEMDLPQPLASPRAR